MIQDLTDDGFTEAINNGVALVWFSAPWCGPCRIVEPILSNLARDYEGRVSFGKINVDDFQHAAALMGICSIPTLLVYKSGEMLQRIVGAVPKKQITAAIELALTAEARQ